MQKLTSQQQKQLIANGKLIDIIKDKLANKERLMWHSMPSQIDAETSTPEQIETFNKLVKKWEEDKKIESFNLRYFPLISDHRSKERRILVLAIADFNYDADKLSGDALLEKVVSTTYQGANIIDILLDKMIYAIQNTPVAIKVSQ